MLVEIIYQFTPKFKNVELVAIETGSLGILDRKSI